MAVVHLVRHGQVDNPSGVHYERLPGFHLTELGRQMAETVATFLAPLPITALRCSPLERAQESMAPIAARFPELAVLIDDRLIEAGSRFAGQVMGPSAKAARLPKNWRHLYNPLRPSWGEAYRAIAERITAAILEIAEQVGEEGQAVAVSHQLPIWVARQRAVGRPLWHDPRRRQCSLASLTSFRVAAGSIVEIEYAEPAADLHPSGQRVGF